MPQCLAALISWAAIATRKANHRSTGEWLVELYNPECIEEAVRQLEAVGERPNVFVDGCHANSGKKYQRQEASVALGIRISS